MCEDLERDPAPQVSVIIPTYNSWGTLESCINALLCQDCNFDYEIIVANNDPDDPPPRWLHACPRVTMISVEQKGSYSARNAAAKAARGSVYCFTDADCIPSPDWLSLLVECVISSTSGLVAGRVEMIPLDEFQITAIEAYDMAVGIRQDLYVKKGVAATANLGVTRDKFELVDGFDSTRFSGGDTDFCKRLAMIGHVVAYCGSAVVKHPARRSWSEISSKARRLAGSKASTRGREFLKNFSSTMAPPIVRTKIILRSSLSKKSKAGALTIMCRLKMIQVLEFWAVLCGKNRTR